MDNVVRVKAPSTLLYFFYNIGLSIATVLAFVAFLIVCCREAIAWLFTRRKKGRISMYSSYWDKISSIFGYFKVYYAVWKLSLKAKSGLKYVDIPISFVTVPAFAVKRATQYGFETVKLMDPFELLIAAVVGFEFSFVLWVLWLFIISWLPARLVYTHLITAPQPKTLSKAAPADYQPNDIQRQQVDLGPFYADSEIDQLRKRTGVNNIALLADTGSARYSSRWTVGIDGVHWIPSSNPNVTSVIVQDAAVSFMDGRGNSFVLNTSQPFVFENVDTLIFYFDSQGGLHQINRDEVNLVHLSVVKSSAKPNSRLTR